MGQKPIEGSNPSLSATRRTNSRRFRSLSRGSYEAGIRTRDIDKGVRQNRRRRFWTSRRSCDGPERSGGRAAQPRAIPPALPYGQSIFVVFVQLTVAATTRG